jgi:ComF family protein
MKLIRDIIFFIFPHVCEVCGRLLTDGEELLCSYCYLDIPRTNFHQQEKNHVVQLFWGRVHVSEATSWFYFSKGGRYQVLLHKLKYQGFGRMGNYLGRCFASELRESVFGSAEILIPVPLHPRKQKKRGYNQSTRIAKGMNEILKISLREDILVRTEFTETQTRRNRYERYLNMLDKFEVQNPEEVINKKVLLIDDVVTTGSTLEACAEVLLKAGCREVLVATIAVA